ncbi:TetR/AcrR family transcriptional regulator [Mycobacterium shimoidei]|uniref:TetR family transcriptional regulator [Nocardia brasiliensis ATCC] n=1 Tax=Mycobacterium shimoidei TaxID=29313 RepID=A0A1E3TDD8_MYCSH|nr:TetR/AcrR family transcriptional regulator [Mycobacterium shimoidei]MCV7259750.1 TetR/AcrR family transcriptional regulator [Mycobacterium shimoidei]ODR12434.1 transcriptional regulator [Mycobacterium shimoidei]ORW81963.1 transcriptional regulator [Mycobacterium shimoidei]SRX94021.1 TetR family transcriptional regulator [Nocardia brasiliensis ATCC] [Mycobacterium shimoidei]
MTPSKTETTTRVRAEHLGPERRRPQVLDTALEIAAEQGVANVTMAAVAERMEVTRPVVYACYAGRGELLSALLERERSWALSNMLAMLPPQRTGSIQQMFVDGFSTLLSSVRERPASWRIIVAADPDPALTADIARGRAQIAERVSTVMRPLMERWQVRDIDRALPVLTEVFLTICETAVRMMLDAQQNWAPDDLADIVGRAAYRALRATT